MKKITYIFWLLAALYYATNSGWTFTQIAFLYCSGMLLFISIVGHLEGETGKGIPSFNDAVSKELMRIRSDLARVRSRQYKSTKSTDDFLRLYFLYFPYSSGFLCTSYQTPDNEWAQIIIQLDSSFDIEENSEDDFDAETLKKINGSEVRRKLKKGMSVSVFISEPGIHDAECSRHAEILSVRNNLDMIDESITLTLEIELSTTYEDMYFTFDSKNDKKKTITREIQIGGFSKCRHFNTDK